MNGREPYPTLYETVLLRIIVEPAGFSVDFGRCRLFYFSVFRFHFS